MSQSRLTIPALLERSAREFGDQTYLVTPTDRPTYREAEQRSAHLARWLLAQGVGKGTRVGLFFPNGAEWVTWWLAVSRVGALAVPMSTLYAPVEIAKVLRLADVGLLLAPPRVLAVFHKGKLQRPIDTTHAETSTAEPQTAGSEVA